jgi:hypothetical protein
MFSINEINRDTIEKWEIVDAYDAKGNKSLIGRALVGGVVFGGAGAAVGAVTSIGGKNKGRKLMILVTLKDGRQNVFTGGEVMLKKIVRRANARPISERSKTIAGDILLTLVTGGLWINWIIIREVIKAFSKPKVVPK